MQNKIAEAWVQWLEPVDRSTGLIQETSSVLD